MWAVNEEYRAPRSSYACMSCGFRLHADVNAAMVILSRGVHGAGWWLLSMVCNGESVPGGSSGPLGCNPVGL